MILYELPWTEAQRLRAVIVGRHTPGDGAHAPSSLESLHARIQGKVRGHG